MELFFCSKKELDGPYAYGRVVEGSVTVTRTYAYFNMWCEMALKCKCTKRILPHYHAEAVLGHNMVKPFPVKEKQFNEWNETIANRHIVRRQKNSCDEQAKNVENNTYLRACLAPYAPAKPKISYFVRATRFNAIVFIAFSIFSRSSPEKSAKCSWVIVSPSFSILLLFASK